MNGRRRAIPTAGAALALAALVVASCAGGGSGAGTSLAPEDPGSTTTLVADPSLVPPVGFTLVTLVVTQPDGATEEFCLWVADTPELRSRGLMNVTDPELGGRAGMVFTYDTDTTTGFWMRSTPLPLTIAYVGADGAVVSIADMEPCPDDADQCPSYPPGGPFRFALEVPQGGLDELGITEESRLAVGDAC